MFGKEYECRDCGRAFRIDEDEKREPKCPGCESGNVAIREARPLPPWLVLKNKTGSS